MVELITIVVGLWLICKVFFVIGRFLAGGYSTPVEHQSPNQIYIHNLNVNVDKSSAPKDNPRIIDVN